MFLSVKCELGQQVQITVTLRPALLMQVYLVILCYMFELSIGTLSFVSPGIHQGVETKLEKKITVGS
jgi:hypothetical protein